MPSQQEALVAALRERQCAASPVLHGGHALLLLGDDPGADTVSWLRKQPMVAEIKAARTPYVLAGRDLHPEDTVIQIGNAKVGGGQFALIAGPCSVESESQILTTAKALAKSGISILRAGAYKPRTSPYTFSGLKEKGLAYLAKAKAETGLPVVSEIVSPLDLSLFEDVDVIQVGAKNMQNYPLLQALGTLQKPVLLKRGYACTVDDLLMSAEYILAGGNTQVILCERGIRTFETQTRYTLDLSAVPVLKRLSHLPVVVDPSHAAGDRRIVPPLALAAVAAGADGVMIEVHDNPACALCDGAQAVTLEGFAALQRKLWQIRSIVTESEV